MMDFVLETRGFIVDGPGQPLNESTLTAFETQIGTKLPTQLRSFYLRWNGGLPCPSSIPEDKSAWVRLYWKQGAEAARVGAATNLQGLFEVNSSPNMDFLRNWNDYKYRIPQDCLCFACDPWG